MGIASVALLSMLGVMAVGMNTMRSAVDTTVQTQIFQEVIGTLRQADYTRLSDETAWSWGFDERGLPVNDPASKIYQATVEVSPARLSGGEANPDLLRVRVLISNTAEPNNIRQITTFIANNGQ